MTEGDSPCESAQNGALSMSLEDQFGRFFQEMQNELPDADQEELVRKILEQQARRSGDYVQKAGDVPKEDSEELLELLRRKSAGGRLKP